MLARAFREDPALPAIAGDLHEDYVAELRRGGARRARWWYRWEVTKLVLGRMWFVVVSELRGEANMTGSARASALRHDMVAALRTMRRSPAVYLLLAVVIGLGVGATTAVYSVVSPLLLRPLPFAHAEELVWIENTGEGGSLSSITSRSSNLRDFRRSASSFDGLTGYMAFFEQSSYTLDVGGTPEQMSGVGVAHDFLEVLGVQPVHGRGFTAEEGVWGGPRAILLSHGYWRRRFAEDASVIGSAVQINGEPHTVVGVLPAWFDFSSVFTPTVPVDILLPFPVGDETDRWGNTMFFIGRLRPGVTVAVAQQELDRLIMSLQEEQPNRWGLGARVMPLRAHVAGPFRPALLLLSLAAAAVMLIVCVNVANILLARSPGRGREIAVRKALGATRGRIVRQLLAESLVMAAAGGAIGIGLAILVTRFISGATGMAIPLLDRVRVDGWALAFAVIAATGAGLLAGLVPALQVAEGGESDTLRATSRGASGHRAAHRLRETLVVAELALACALLVAGGLMLRSFQAVLAVDLGFDPENAVAWKLNPSAAFESFDEMTSFYTSVTERVRALRGVEGVGLNDALPLGKNRSWVVRIAGEAGAADEPGVGIFPHMIDAGYLDAMRIRLVDGRNISPRDTDDTPLVVLINETAAATLFPGERAVGRRIVTSGGDDEREIVGVVADVKHVTPERGAGVQVYFPMAQMWDFGTMDLVVRSRLPAASLASAVSAALAEIDPQMPTRDYWTLEQTLDRSVSARRFTLQILAGFGAVALLLAALGVYGVLAQSVSERTREIGIRMALGASAGSVRRALVARTLLLAVTGIGLGLLIALAGSRLIAAMLYGVPAADPVTLSTIAAVLLGVALMSGLLPALRASRTDALAIMRGD
jgi:predicted permease